MKGIRGSLFEVEKKQATKQRNHAKWKEKLRLLSHLSFKVRATETPREVLRRAGYKPIGNGWIYPIDEKTRFHAFPRVLNVIEIHHDTSRGEGKRHIASRYGVPEEIKRICAE